MPRKKTQDPPHLVHSQREVAEFFGIATITVAQWVSAGMPMGHRRYDLQEIAKWRQSRKTEPAKDDPEKEYKRHRADLMKLRLEQERGSLVPREHYEGRMLRVCQIFKAALLSRAPTIAAEVGEQGDRARLEILKRRFEEILEDVSLNVSIGSEAAPKKRRGRKAKLRT